MKIKAKLPIGFKLLVEESFQGSGNDKIFVFENVKSKKKLYAKLCSLEDIRQGFIWEILTPEDLKELKIEESVNESYYGKGKVIEESVSEDDDEQERIRKETEEFMRKQKEKNSQVVINLVGKGGQGEGDNLETLRAENEDLKNKLSIIAYKKYSKKQAEAIQRGATPDQVNTPEMMMEWEKNPTFIDPTRRGSSGTLTLSGQSNTGSGTEFASQFEMIAELQRRENSPKASPEEKRESKAILNEL